VAREPFEGSDRQEAAAERRSVGLLPKVLIALGIILVAGAVVSALGGFQVAFESEQLDPTGKAIGAPFERLHEAQQKKIKAAMSSPFVLGIPRARLEAIAECESHGDPRAIGGGGLYRGKYQFHRGTWASVGGTGDPARASELEQDRRAAMLIKQSGSNPWPICG
jgi:hypothetical protein